MPAAPSANLTLLPWVRQGAAGAIATVDTLGATQAAVADLSITLNVNAQSLPTVPVRLRGPADVVGIDVHQILRTDPRPGTNDFESNCFASIEFDRADFPWLFTPAHANTDARLRPWLCLVVVRKQDGITLTSTVDSPLPVLQIVPPAKPFVELPNLKESWAWAHAQAAGTGTDATAVGNALNGAPQLSLSRLVCPRLLAPNTDYLACVVPAFELGRKAGLGLPIADPDLTATNALAQAWTLTATTPLQVQLPVYYSWHFRTAQAGDFKSLAELLRISSPAGLGQRTIRIGEPGFPASGVPQSATVNVEGALMPLVSNAGSAAWTDSVALPFETALAGIVNQPGQNQVIAPNADPLVAPPLYGRWHAGRALVAPGAANWFDQLNLDPRWRTAAALGTRVIQQNQEELMASAWEQAAEMPAVNQRMRQLQLSMAVGESLHARHLSRLSEEMALRIASPVFSRIRIPSETQPLGHSLTAAQMFSMLPVPATQAPMRRIGRQRGPLTRRIVAQGYPRSPFDTWVVRLNSFAGFPAAARRPDTIRANISVLPSVDSVVNAIWNSGFLVAPENQPVAPLPSVDPLPPEWDYPGAFRAAAASHLSRIRTRSSTNLVFPSALADTLGYVLAQMRPRVALAKLARGVISTGDNILQPSAPGVTPVGTETVMMAPSFPQPMYEPLKEKSQDLLLPGLDAVEAERVVGLKTNRAFVEAYMIGLNIEMGRELLWRGFPTDQQGTYFKHFWGTDAGPSAADDLDDLRRNLGRALGGPVPNAPPEQFVLLLRSSLLRRFPNAIIYLTPALTGASPAPPPDVFPIFNGAMEPDINFFGFPVTPAAAVGSPTSPGYFVVIQEHPTEPRFGLDASVVNNLVATRSHLAIGTQPPAGVPLKGRTWGKNSAHMAEITRRLPVRITIHASQLVAVQ
ncbi:MAG TPA: hypothetical protein VKE96_01170 [Vicinamibacterales bacterium]|nr:hypothetical protein [Vicinamibacterales bacterium]